MGITNLSFKMDKLPYPIVGGIYDLVTCFATLHYIREIERAIRNLFKLVKRGGYLIFNYPNVHTRQVYKRDIAPDDEYMKQRFALILAGENLLSMKKIKELLGVKPRRFYSSIRSNVYVSIYKN
jgi:2-polyprenyl-3-methyl-5-hydroxy-6-metoxy-1,4-benzoquinol methylase